MNEQVKQVLEQVIGSGDQWAVERAQYVSQVQDSVQSGQMTSDEAKEVLQDLVATQQLQEAAQLDQTKAALYFAITQLVSMYA
jgi:polyhydroxyalkanoate synthesis regulator phasin